MLTIPASSPPRSTSMWRTRWCVIRFITRLTLSSGESGRTVLHDFLQRHRRGCLAKARKCVNDFTFGNETKNCFPIRHRESANLLCTEPVRCSLDAGFWSYCCDVGALPPQNAFDGHRLLPSGDLVAYLIDARGSAGPAPAIGEQCHGSRSPLRGTLAYHIGREQSASSLCLCGPTTTPNTRNRRCCASKVLAGVPGRLLAFLDGLLRPTMGFVYIVHGSRH